MLDPHRALANRGAFLASQLRGRFRGHSGHWLPPINGCINLGATSNMPDRHGFCPRLILQKLAGERLLIQRARLPLARVEMMRATSGAAGVEFALVVPLLLLVLLGTFVFGITLNNYIMVTNAAQTGTFQLTVSRGGSTPYTDTVNAITSSAPGLIKEQLTISLTVNGTACSSDGGCQTALTSASGKDASVEVSYPCSLIIMQVNYAPACTLKAKSTGRIQ